ncbi:AsmA [Polaromonas sp. CG9_12]|nr:AsmA [Polaromonas sp. CG9_12]
MKTSLNKSSTLRYWLAGLGIVLTMLVLVIFFFPWDSFRGPINRYVSDQLGRRFEITRHLSVRLGLITTVSLEGIEIENPEWARNPYLLKANAAQFDVSLLPLVVGKVVLPNIRLNEPRIALEAEPDGRKTWAFSRDTSKKGTAPQIGSFIVDRGSVNYLAKAQGADLDAQFALASDSGNALPLSFKVTGRWNDGAFTANGRTGGVLQLSRDSKVSFPLEVNAVAGRTRLAVKGSLADLVNLDGIDATFDLQGENLDDLYGLLGVVLPATPPYKLRGKLDKREKIWAVSQIQGLLGKSDLSGALSFDQSSTVPLLTGKVQSKVMDFADLAPVIGIAPSRGSTSKPNSAITSKGSKAALSAANNQSVSTGAAPGKVLPRTPLAVPRLNAMNADVTYAAADILHVKELPLDKGSVHVKLQAGVLQLEPITLGVAGGSVAGTIRIDSTVVPAAITTRLDVRALQLNQLFPAVESTKTGYGKFSGQFNLRGRGNSVAQMLGSASGDVAILMGKGEISNILLEFMGLDGGEVIKFLVRGDKTVQLRCAAAAFDVKQGLMTSRAIVLDTSDTVITGQGQISLANETLDILFKPQPKDMSILSLRSPLRIGGTFAKTTAGPEASALAGRVGIALVLAAINPLLALAATIETGPGENADCAAVLSNAAKATVANGK